MSKIPLQIAKRYFLFQGISYSQQGGWNDFSGTFNTVDEALQHRLPKSSSPPRWWQIVDQETLSIVDEYGGYGPYSGIARDM